MAPHSIVALEPRSWPSLELSPGPVGVSWLQALELQARPEWLRKSGGGGSKATRCGGGRHVGDGQVWGAPLGVAMELRPWPWLELCPGPMVVDLVTVALQAAS